jgi:hypothetical protein
LLVPTLLRSNYSLSLYDREEEERRERARRIIAMTSAAVHNY